MPCLCGCDILGSLGLLLFSSTDIGREAGGLEPGTSVGKRHVMVVPVVRPGGEGALCV